MNHNNNNSIYNNGDISFKNSNTNKNSTHIMNDNNNGT